MPQAEDISKLRHSEFVKFSEKLEWMSKNRKQTSQATLGAQPKIDRFPEHRIPGQRLATNIQQVLWRRNALLETPRPIKRSRKELDRLKVDDWAKEAVVDAAEWTVMRTPDYLHASIQSQVTLCGKTIASVLKEEDKPALFVPADIVTETGNQTGVVLNTDSGAVFGWTEGRFRLSYFAMTIPHTVVRELSTLGPSDDYNASLHITMDAGSLNVHFAGVRSEDGPTGLLDGIVASLKGEGQA